MQPPYEKGLANLSNFSMSSIPRAQQNQMAATAISSTIELFAILVGVRGRTKIEAPAAAAVIAGSSIDKAIIHCLSGILSR
jgi:hypothetical protein